MSAYNMSHMSRGTSGIDIDLQRVDIDQCPLPPDKADELNVFAGSAKCKRETTKVHSWFFFTFTPPLFFSNINACYHPC